MLYTVLFVLCKPCFAVLYSTMLCYAMVQYAVICYAVVRYAALSYAMLCCALLCQAVLCHAVLCQAVLASDGPKCCFQLNICMQAANLPDKHRQTIRKRQYQVGHRHRLAAEPSEPRGTTSTTQHDQKKSACMILYDARQ